MNADAVITDRFNYTRYSGGKAEMLYDLENDPDENKNVSSEPDNAETLAKMRQLLNQRMDEAKSTR